MSLIQGVNMNMPAPPSIGGGPDNARGKAWEDFSSVLAQQIRQTDDLHHDAVDLTQKALLGNAGVSLHEAQIAGAKAELHMRLLIQVRNKAVEVYREIMSMPA